SLFFLRVLPGDCVIWKVDVEVAARLSCVPSSATSSKMRIMVEQFSTRRLAARRFGVEDEGELAQVLARSREHLARWIPVLAASDSLAARLADWAHEFDTGSRFVYGLRRTACGDLIGSVSLTPTPPGALEISYWLDVRHLGQGFATEAVLGAVEAAAGARVELRCDRDHVASMRVALRAGFELVATEGRTQVWTVQPSATSSIRSLDDAWDIVVG